MSITATGHLLHDFVSFFTDLQVGRLLPGRRARVAA